MDPAVQQILDEAKSVRELALARCTELVDALQYGGPVEISVEAREGIRSLRTELMDQALSDPNVDNDLLDHIGSWTFGFPAYQVFHLERALLEQTRDLVDRFRS